MAEQRIHSFTERDSERSPPAARKPGRYRLPPTLFSIAKDHRRERQSSTVQYTVPMYKSSRAAFGPLAKRFAAEERREKAEKTEPAHSKPLIAGC
jgi:hypothetical protein